MRAIPNQSGPDAPAAVLDTDTNTLTTAITLRWSPPWALDKCEALHVLGVVRRAVATALADVEMVAGFSMRSWDPNEELQMGYLADYSQPSCPECGSSLVDDGNHFYCHPEDRGRSNKLPGLNCQFLDGGEGYVNFANALDVTFDRTEQEST